MARLDIADGRDGKWPCIPRDTFKPGGVEAIEITWERVSVSWTLAAASPIVDRLC